MLAQEKPEGKKKVQTCTNESQGKKKSGLDYLYPAKGFDPDGITVLDKDSPLDGEAGDRDAVTVLDEVEQLNGEDQCPVGQQQEGATATVPTAYKVHKDKKVKDKNIFSSAKVFYPFGKKGKKISGYWSEKPRCPRNVKDMEQANERDKFRLRAVLDLAKLTEDQEEWIKKLHVCISKYAHLSMDDYCGSPNLKKTLRCFFTKEMETGGALADLNGSKPSSRLLVWGPPGTGGLFFNLITYVIIAVGNCFIP